jgi:hypothetical protein
VPYTDGPARDDELLRPAVRQQRRTQAYDVDAGNEEVCVLRLDAEQLVANRPADNVRAELERPHIVLDPFRHPYGASAIASISTSAPEGSFATSTVERAGGVPPTCFE